MIYFITIASDASKLSYLQQSACMFANEVIYIIVETWKSNVDKIHHMKKSIENFTDDDIICFIDAYDVIFNASHGEIEKRFREFNSDVVFSAEVNCYPDRYRKNFDKLNITSSFRYLNSGGYIGYKKNIWEILTWKTEFPDKKSDQAYFIQYYLANLSKNIKLDTDCKIFQSMTRLEWTDFNVQSGHVFNSIMKVYPCIIHFNGSSYEQSNGENVMKLFLQKMDITKYKNSIENFVGLSKKRKIIVKQK